jgi:hypothetical protein
MAKKLKSALIRLTERDFASLKARAFVYAGGDLTRWITHAGLNCPGKFLIESDISRHIEDAVREKKSRRQKKRRQNI